MRRGEEDAGRRVYGRSSGGGGGGPNSKQGGSSNSSSSNSSSTSSSSSSNAKANPGRRRSGASGQQQRQQQQRCQKSPSISGAATTPAAAATAGGGLAGGAPIFASSPSQGFSASHKGWAPPVPQPQQEPQPQQQQQQRSHVPHSAPQPAIRTPQGGDRRYHNRGGRRPGLPVAAPSAAVAAAAAGATAAEMSQQQQQQQSVRRRGWERPGPQQHSSESPASFLAVAAAAAAEARVEADAAAAAATGAEAAAAAAAESAAAEVGGGGCLVSNSEGEQPYRVDGGPSSSSEGGGALPEESWDSPFLGPPLLDAALLGPPPALRVPPRAPRFPPSAPLEVGALRGPLRPSPELRREAHVQRLLLQLCQDDASRFEEEQQQEHQQQRRQQQQQQHAGGVDSSSRWGACGVPEVVQGRYHSLLLLDSEESLERQRLLQQQQQQLPCLSLPFGYPTLSFKALCLDDPHAYVLRVVASFPISSFDLVKAAVSRWASVTASHPNIVPLRQAFATADFSSCLSFLCPSSGAPRPSWGPPPSATLSASTAQGAPGAAAAAGPRMPLPWVIGVGGPCWRGRVGGVPSTSPRGGPPPPAGDLTTSDSEEEDGEGDGVRAWGSKPRSSSSSSSVVFVSDYCPNAYSLEERFCLGDKDRNPTPENVVWTVGLQVLMALVHIHKHNLSVWALLPSTVLVTHRLHVLLDGCGVCDATLHCQQQQQQRMTAAAATAAAATAAAAGPTAAAVGVCCGMGPAGEDDIEQKQQQDLVLLGRILLALTCGSVVYEEPDDCRSWWLRFMGDAAYTGELKSFCASLLSPWGGSGAGRGFTAASLLEAYACQALPLLQRELSVSARYEALLFSEMARSRAFLLLAKLCFVVDSSSSSSRGQQPGGGGGSSSSSLRGWGEAGDAYVAGLFRDLLFCQRGPNGEPIVDFGHLSDCIHKCDLGTEETAVLMSSDGASFLLVSYRDIRRCIDNCFRHLVAAAAAAPPLQPLHPDASQQYPAPAPAPAAPAGVAAAADFGAAASSPAAGNNTQQHVAAASLRGTDAAAAAATANGLASQAYDAAQLTRYGGLYHHQQQQQQQHQQLLQHMMHQQQGSPPVYCQDTSAYYLHPVQQLQQPQQQHPQYLHQQQHTAFGHFQ